MDIEKLAKESLARIIQYRRHIHENPELSGVEYQTIAFIKAKLDEYHIKYEEIPHGGILAIIDSNKEGKTVLLRADIDALPIDESLFNGEGKVKQCISKAKNISHACGHDSHTAMLLVALQILSENITSFKGKIYGIFEQGEESNGNIFHIIKYFEDNNIKYDYCFGIHAGAFNKLKTGSMIIPPGHFYAGMKYFKFKIIGKGGHGARPDLANNPMDSFVDIYHQLKSFDVDDFVDYEKLTYSIGHVVSGSKANIIPDELEFEGTIRFYQLDVGIKFENYLKQLVKDVCVKNKMTYEHFTHPLPGFPVDNHIELTNFINERFKAVLNEEIIAIEPKMSSESYAVYQKFAPGIFMNLVTNNIEKGITSGVHTATFEVDEQVLYKGVMAHIAFALECLNLAPIFTFKREYSADDIIKLCAVDLDKVR